MGRSYYDNRIRQPIRLADGWARAEGRVYNHHVYGGAGDDRFVPGPIGAERWTTLDEASIAIHAGAHGPCQRCKVDTNFRRTSGSAWESRSGGDYHGDWDYWICAQCADPVADRYTVEITTDGAGTGRGPGHGVGGKAFAGTVYAVSPADAVRIALGQAYPALTVYVGTRFGRGETWSVEDGAHVLTSEPTATLDGYSLQWRGQPRIIVRDLPSDDA